MGVEEMQSSLWDKMIPRFVAAGGFAYLVYSLVWRGTDLSYLHVLVFLLVVVLVLVPFARRLKIPGVIDFESKLESLREETRKEIGEIRNQISTTLESHITPVQHQWTVIGMGEPLVKQLAQSITEEFQHRTSVETVKGDKYTRTWFLREADSYRAEGFDMLLMAYYMHMAVSEQRPFDKDKDLLAGSRDEKINHMINHLLDGGIELFVPPSEIAETVEGLQAFRTILEIRRKVDEERLEIPNQQETHELFGKIGNALSGIRAGIILQGWQAILYRYEVAQKLKDLRQEFSIDD